MIESLIGDTLCEQVEILWNFGKSESQGLWSVEGRTQTPVERSSDRL
jgi:hypothetical protein